MVTEPIDCVNLSNTGLKVVPPFVVFHRPPPAEPTYNILASLFTASRQLILPLVTAGPICRDFSEPKISGEISDLLCGKRKEVKETTKINNEVFISPPG